MPADKPRFDGPRLHAGAFAPDRGILESVAVGIFAVDRELKLTFLNRAAERIAGVKRERALGKPCRQVFKSTLCEINCPVALAMARGEEQENLEAVFIRQQGRSVAPVRVSAAPLLGPEGRVAGAVASFQAIPQAEVAGRVGKRIFTWDDYVGASQAVKDVCRTLKVVSPSDATILLEGPTGTGKDLLAKIIHHNSARPDGPFVKVNCAALPEPLLESELFGYVKGAFTGAAGNKPGRFQMAHGGTIFLDEIGEVPLNLQAKLLRVLEDREFFPLGASRTSRVDVRVLAASNRLLERQVAEGQFREDLFYRLNVIKVRLPALAERTGDLPLLINRYIQKKNVEKGSFICRFNQGALDILLNYHYPGNVREMENILEHACLLCRGDIIREEHLPTQLLQMAATHFAARPGQAGADQERQTIAATLSRCKGNRSKAAKLLGINRSTLWRRMKRLGLA